LCPLLERYPASGNFALRLWAERSTALGGFEPMSFGAGQLLLGPDGGLEYRFPGGDADAAFYRVRADAKPR